MCLTPSLPLRECGLKYTSLSSVLDTNLSLPLRECGLKYVWPPVSCVFHLSLPLRECGLKCPSAALSFKRSRSLPLRECGLKYIKNVFVGFIPLSHSPCGSVDWNLFINSAISHWYSHSPCGSVDWNSVRQDPEIINPRHSPCGSVDWNMFTPSYLNFYFVTPLAGVWIEIIFINNTPIGSRESLPLRECGLK